MAAQIWPQEIDEFLMAFWAELAKMGRRQMGGGHHCFWPENFQ
jgi:hypothetical protein